MRNIVILPISALTVVSVWIGQPRITFAESSMSSAQIGTDTLCKATGIATTTGKPGECIEPTVARRSLTVIGQGLVTAPADTALLEFRFGNRESSSSADINSPGLSIQDVRQATEVALKPVVAALTEARIPTRNITIQTSSLQAPRVLVRVDRPNQDRLQQIVLIVNRAIGSSQQLFLQSIGAGYTVNSCQFLERSARRIALKDAQNQLTDLAKEVGVELGELLSVVVLPLVGPSSSAGCGVKVGVPISPLSVGVDEATPPYNPSDKPEVQVRSQVSVTHAIQSSQQTSK